MSLDAEFVAFYNSCRAEMADSIKQNILLLSSSAVKALRGLLTRRSVSDETRLKAVLAVLKLSSGPIEGPREVVEARAEIALKKRKLDLKCTMARLGVDGRDLLDHLDRPVEPDDAELDDDELDEEPDDEDGPIDEAPEPDDGPLKARLADVILRAIGDRVATAEARGPGEADPSKPSSPGRHEL
jgi:hypothetical protein